MKLTTLLFGIIVLTISINASGNEIINKINEAYQSGKINYEESLLQKFYAVFNKSQLNTEFYVSTNQPVKCVTSLISEFRKNSNKLSNETNQKIEKMINPRLKTKSNSITTSTYISPYEKFEITYSTIGQNAVPTQDLDNSGIPDYVEKVAEYFDRSWKTLIDTLGFYSIPLSNGEYYQISFENMGAYGYTDWNGSSAGTEIVMHCNFQGFPPNDDPDGNVLGAAKVTAVHEFKHAIQFVYNQWSEPGWFIEADATWSEDIGFDYVNDYYNYLGSSQIRNPGVALFNGGDLNGYEDNLYFHFFSERYSINTNREIWERRAQYNESVFSSIENMLTNYNAYFDSSFVEYYTWMYNSGNRFDSTLAGFDEAQNYPSPSECIVTSESVTDAGCNREALSGNFLVFESNRKNQYLQFDLNTPSGNNFVSVIIHFIDNSSTVDYYELNNLDTFNLFVQSKLPEIDYIVFIPVVTSISGTGFDYDYSFDVFKTAEFDHTPLTDTETSGDIEFLVKLETPQDLAYTDSLKVFYQINLGGYQSLQMQPNENPSEYSALISDPGLGVRVDYYFRINDKLNDTIYYPETAPDSVFSFFIGSDETPPFVEHNQIEKGTRFDFPLTLFANFSDNTYLDSTYVEYRINDGELSKTNFVKLSGNLFYSMIDIDENELTKGDTVYYRITATDSSSNKNIAHLPADDFFSLGITDGYKFSLVPSVAIGEQVQSTKSIIAVEEDIIIDDINVYVKTNHSKFSELQIRLLSPNRTNTILYEQEWLGTFLDNIENPFITFNDNAYFNMSSIVFVDSQNAVGNVQTTKASLDRLIGTSTLGNWTLAIFDQVEDGFNGDLLEWGLIIEGDISTSVDSDAEKIPNEYSLSQNYPNPFNPTTQITFSIPKSGVVKLTVYDILGREIQTLVDKKMQAGKYEVGFNGVNLGSGIYFYNIKVDNFTQTNKMILIK